MDGSSKIIRYVHNFEVTLESLDLFYVSSFTFLEPGLHGRQSSSQMFLQGRNVKKLSIIKILPSSIKLLSTIVRRKKRER